MNHVKGKFIRLFFILVILSTLIIPGCSSRSSEAVPPKDRANEEIINQEPINMVNEDIKTEEPIVEPVQIETIDQIADPPVENNAQELSQTLKPSIPILYYHSIDYEEGNELRVSPEEFETHMEFLSQNGYESITLNDLYQYFYEGKVLPEKTFVLTFDDGYEDNYAHAFPIAEKYGYSGTIFMVTGWIGGTEYLKEEQLLEMSRAGWQIESHTIAHPYLNSLSKEQIKEELLTSKKILEEMLSEPKIAFAYPYGVYDSLIIELCRETGYKMGLTTDRGWAGPEDSFRIKRVYCYAQMGLDEFKRRVENANY
ncbi:polysaccharide deacetylase family protein [Desulfitobacterium sp. PCE1]|uniref:polysaccharide deacetylase family protein n=1 Tax=Desulfitobacterium sp. PCE1 TaxID=146907 RepID=UPI000375EA9E|nr:polysaccharide deacetylase family protein [Desulfitobacterium sp. PCE1]